MKLNANLTASAAEFLPSAFMGQAALAESMLAMTSDQKRLTFDTSAPSLGSLTAISGLIGNDRLRAIDLRPTTGIVYALGTNSTLYTLNASTGVASLVASLSADATDTSDTFTGLRGTAFGCDFTPVADLTGVPSPRVVSNASATRICASR